MVKLKDKSNIHETEVIIDKKKLKAILDGKYIGYTELYDEVIEKYGLDLGYKGFMAILDNRSAWKLTYAWAVAGALNIEIKDIFVEKRVDVNEKKEKIKQWKKRYQPDKEQ